MHPLLHCWVSGTHSIMADSTLEATIRSRVHQYLSGAGLYDELEAVLATAGSDPAAIAAALRSSGVVQAVVDHLTTPGLAQPTAPGTTTSAASTHGSQAVTGSDDEWAAQSDDAAGEHDGDASSSNSSPVERQLVVRFHGGRAWLAELLRAGDADSMPAAEPAQRWLLVTAVFRGVQAAPLIAPMGVDPSITGQWTWSLASSSHAWPSATALLAMQDTLQLLVFQLTISQAADVDAASRTGWAALASLPSARMELLCTRALPWRRALAVDSGHRALLELRGCGSWAGVSDLPIGTLDASFAVQPVLLTARTAEAKARWHSRVQQAVADEAVAAERSMHAYLRAASTWLPRAQRAMATAPMASEAHAPAQPLLAWARDERGRKVPLPAYVQPWVADRTLLSPRHAARWISLLPRRVCEIA